MTFLDVELAVGPSARSSTALPDCVRSSDSQETTPHASFAKTPFMHATSKASMSYEPRMRVTATRKLTNIAHLSTVVNVAS